MLPCIDKESLKLLTATADERYQFNREYFRRTHYPQIMHRFYRNRLSSQISEQDLLEELMEVDSTGNRVYLVFGSTGAGKSELLCWLRDKWEDSRVERPVIRISRSELNPQVLIKKCYECIGLNLEMKIDENQWVLLLSKPITIVNQIVWSALSECLPTDEVIVPIALLLRPVIEANIFTFTKQIQKGKIKNPLELITKEQFDEVISTTTIPIEIEHKVLQQLLLQKLDHFLFNGRDIDTLFKQLSSHLKEFKIRPLLLIDDLVQSVNIYATDLLDHVITLEEGNWDVVIGLTPGSLQDSISGREITERIQNLDTFDDRVKKLWLSDESGKEFYNLERSKVHVYMSKYLMELKASRGFDCSKECAHYKNCKGFLCPGSYRENEEDKEVVLLPLSTSLVRRMYDGVPIGKSKLRHMIINTKEILRFFNTKDKKLADRIQPLISRELFAEYEDSFIKLLGEWYSEENAKEINISSKLLKHFGYSDMSVSLSLNSLVMNNIDERGIGEYFREDNLLEANSLHIRDWVEGKDINPQLLQSVRSGVSCLANDIVKSTNIMRKYTSRMSASLQRIKIENGTRYPTAFADEQEGSVHIDIQRGYAAWQVNNFQSLKLSEKSRRFLRISDKSDVASWVYQSDQLYEEWVSELEKELGTDLSLLTYKLRLWCKEWAAVSSSEWLYNINSPFNKSLLGTTEEMYRDWFIMRENLIDFLKVQVNDDMEFDTGKWLLTTTFSKKLGEYSVGDIPLYDFFVGLQKDFIQYKMLVKECLQKELKENEEFSLYLNAKNDYRSRECLAIVNEVSSDIEYDEILWANKKYISWSKLIIDLGYREQYEELKLKRVQALQEFHRFKAMEQNIIDLGSEITEDSFEPSIMDYDPSWSLVDNEIDKWIALGESMKLIYETLLATPRSSVKKLFHINGFSIVEDIRLLWGKIYRSIRVLQKGGEDSNNLKSYLASWSLIDFHQINTQLNKEIAMQSNINSLLNNIKENYRVESEVNKVDVMEMIQKDTKVRPAIKKQISNLIDKGYSRLPPSQGRKIVEELYESFPKISKSVSLQLIVNKERRP